MPLSLPPRPYEPPEHPEITLDTLRHTPEENARTILNYLIERGFVPMAVPVLVREEAMRGTGEPPQVLTACPAERFCKLPGGEVCVYGVAEATEKGSGLTNAWGNDRAVDRVRPGGPVPVVLRRCGRRAASGR